MRKRSLKLVATAIAVSAAALLAGCSSSGAPAPVPSSSGPFDMAALVKAAKAEGSLTMYGGAAPDKLKLWGDAFTKQYGIPVTVLRNTPSALYQQFAQEEAAGRGQADVFGILDHTLLDQAVKNGWIAKYTPQEAAAVPQDISRPGYYYAVENITSEAIAYNTNNVSADEVKKLKADPMGYISTANLKGRVGIINPQAGQAIQAYWYLYSDGPQAKKYGWKTLQGIAANTGKISDTVTIVQNTIQGEVDFAMPVADTYITGLIASGSPLGYVYTNSSVDVSEDFGVAAQAPHPNAARLFMEWATAKDGISAWATAANTQPLRSDVPDPRTYLNAPWYQKKPETWTTFATDKGFLAAFATDGPYFDKWDKTFNYNG